MSQIKTFALVLILSLLPGTPALSQDQGSRDSTDRDDFPAYVRKAIEAQDELSGIISDLVPSFVFIGGGSGVLISEKGHFLTNYHVLAEKLKQERNNEKTDDTVDRVFNVELVGGKSRRAFVVGMDPLGDLALCKIVNGNPPFNHLDLGDSDRIDIGQYVIAIGNPFMRGKFTARPIVTFGLISAKHVFKRRYPDALQTDAPINPGNSGGPLIQLDGSLIGINGRIETKFGTRANSGVGYAISSNRIKRFLPILKKGGIAFHGNSDLIEQTRTEEGYKPKYLENKNGTLVMKRDPEEDSNPYNAGLRKGDRIQSLGGYPINSFRRLVGIIRSVPGPNELDLSYVRDGTTKNATLKLSQYGNWENKQLLKSLPVSEKAPYLGIAVEKQEDQLTVVKVADESPASKAGLKEGDRILKINDRPTPNAEAVKRMIQSRWYGETLSVTIRRGDTEKTIRIKLGRRKKN